MRRYFILLLLLLFFVRCSENEERNPSDQETMTKNKAYTTPYSKPEKNESGLSSEKNVPPGSILIHKKRIKRKDKTIIQSESIAEKRTIDTTLIKKLTYLRNSDLDIDLREPVNQAYLFSPVENPEFSSMILLSHDRSFRINFDNDIFDNTDRYYTNGIRFDFISPFLKQSPLSWLMVPYWGKGINYYGVSIGQNMYTPSTTKVGGIHFGDRPYSAYLIFGSFKISNDPGKKFRQTSDIDLGVIGPMAFGDFLQKTVHSNLPTNSEPLGWEYQIENDFILNYNLTYEKGVISTRRVELNLNGVGALGTLYTNLGGGFQFRAGKMNPYFGSYGFSRKNINKIMGCSKFQAFIFVTSLGKLVGYDATLEGGMFNKSSIYTLNSNEISRLTYQGSLGLTISYEGVRLDVEQFLLSPEFHGCAWHKWVHIGLTIGM
jgi:lipid A 3-O-deacylase